MSKKETQKHFHLTEGPYRRNWKDLKPSSFVPPAPKPIRRSKQDDSVAAPSHAPQKAARSE